MNVFSEMIFSFVGVKKYPEFLQNKKGKVFLYVLLVVLLFCGIGQMKTIPNTTKLITEIRDALMEAPDFELSNGKLKMEESFSFNESGVLVIIGSESGSYISEYNMSEWYDVFDGYESVLILDETTMLVMSEGEIQTMDYPVEFEFSKQTVSDALDYIYVFVVIFLVFYYLYSVMAYFFNALFVALVGMIICSAFNEKLTFGQLYLLSLYAKTLPLLLKGLLKLVSLEFPGSGFFLFVIACIYLGVAINHIHKIEERKRITREMVMTEEPVSMPEDPFNF